jgi:uncharacterized protein (TIGR00661 family)
MKILYGVQATGQGHISRARAMAVALRRLDVQVSWLFSGRARQQLFDMELFGDFQHRRGLTFATRAGRIRYRRTLGDNHLPGFLRDVRELSLAGYDAIVTDFEPVTAWAGRRAGIPTIGIGHQYAFGGATPTENGHWLARRIMHQFAPASLALGLHWHPYADNVLPPILDLPDIPRQQGDHILVYLPFEDQREVTRWLQQFPGQRFRQYAPGLVAADCANVSTRPPAIDAFKQDLANSAGVICNSGFELISECLQWHKPVLTRPLRGQLEQLSNARALAQLGYATVMHQLCAVTLEHWLVHRPGPPALYFPDVAARLARWLADGARQSPAQLCRQLWQPRPGVTVGAAGSWRDPFQAPLTATTGLGMRPG